MLNGQLVFLPDEIENSDPHDEDGLRVVVAYEDLATAKRALRLFDRTALGLKAGGHGAMHCAMWKIGGSMLPTRMKISADQAATADLIVIAAHERATMPEVLQEWISLWLPKKIEQPCGLFALLDHPAESYAQRGIYRYLKSVACFGKLSFFTAGREEHIDEALQAGAPCDDQGIPQ